MNRYTRIFSIARNSVDVEAGTFEADVFTGGEATDGHILNMAGGKSAERIPLFVNHEADPRTQVGSLHFIGRRGDAFRYRGEVALDLEGEEGAVARNLLRKMNEGHVNRMSGRWDFDEADVTRRVNLPKNHPAHVSDKASGPQRWGSWFERWSAMEGSIVGLGADPAATMRALAEDIEPAWSPVVPDGDSVGEPVVDEATAALDAETVREAAEVAGGLSPLDRFCDAARELRDSGIEPGSLVDALAFAFDLPKRSLNSDATNVDMAEDVDAVDAAAQAVDAYEGLEARLDDISDRLRGLEEAVSRAEGPAAVAPDEPANGARDAAEGTTTTDADSVTPTDLGTLLGTMLAANREKVRGDVRALIEQATGVINARADSGKHRPHGR